MLVSRVSIRSLGVLLAFVCANRLFPAKQRGGQIRKEVTTKPFRRNGLGVLFAVVVGLLISGAARADAIFVANRALDAAGAGTIGEYTTSGLP